MVEQCYKVHHWVYHFHASPSTPWRTKMISTAKDFKLFKNRVRFWMNRFGLLGWEEVFDHSDTEQEGQNTAIGWDLEGRTCTFFLHETIEEPFDIEQEAFHVVGHLFLSRISDMAIDRHMSAKELREELNTILRTLANLLLKS